jgi:periodic tryptophan protein 2
VKLWDVFSGKDSRESVTVEGDVVAIAFRPDGKQLVSSTLKGLLEVWAYPDMQLFASIDGRRDLLGGRLVTDKVCDERRDNNMTRAMSVATYVAWLNP